MNRENLWITQIQLKGHYWDATLYSGLLYLWRTPHKLHIYHWERWRDTIPLHEIPIYLSPLPVQLLDITIGELQPYFYKEILFSKGVRDFFVYDHRLYFLDEEGFFSLDPESAEPHPQLLAKGDFSSLILSERNRLVLCAGERGVFEYPLSARYHFPTNQRRPLPLQHWSSQPAFQAEWLGQDLAIHGKENQPTHLLRFQAAGGRVQLMVEQPVLKQQTYPTFYSKELDLAPRLESEGHEWGSLFHYPPAPSQNWLLQEDLQGNRLHRMPNPHFPHAPLEETQLYLEEREDGLHVLKGPVPLLHFQESEHLKWRTFSKSRLYQHYLQLIKEDSLSMLLFFQKK